MKHLPSYKPHVFSDTFNGWHRDVNELPGLVVNDLNFISMFINLSNVHEESGAFEVIPESFTCQLEDGMDSFKAIGEAGSTFFGTELYYIVLVLIFQNQKDEY